MTVAAVLLFAGPDEALADAAGRAAVRRIVEAAWAGGATPIVVVCADADGGVAAALAGSPAVLAEPAPAEAGPVGQIMRGINIAAERVTETDAALVWPGPMAWVDAETVTSLIERHGVDRDVPLRPKYGDETGWPALVPMEVVDSLAALPTELTATEALEQLALRHGIALVDTGDPGTIHDIGLAIDALPQFEGPPEPARPAPEWGAAAADAADETPLEGPALAPYGQATQDAE
ncbi:MAG TPA: NTP transferase domain-containing protein [Candidatus Limnocylindria bacterium]|nr:NTP transferase domain-containing protein [Candidatus Limnocylindria bacterium]